MFVLVLLLVIIEVLHCGIEAAQLESIESLLREYRDILGDILDTSTAVAVSPSPSATTASVCVDHHPVAKHEEINPERHHR